jgi:hypothetical protein
MTTTWHTPDGERRRSSAMTALLPVLKHAINLVLDNFDCSGSAQGRHAGSVFSSAKSDFPAPTVAINQFNDGVFYSSVFHGKAANLSGSHPLVGDLAARCWARQCTSEHNFKLGHGNIHGGGKTGQRPYLEGSMRRSALIRRRADCTGRSDGPFAKRRGNAQNICRIPDGVSNIEHVKHPLPIMVPPPDSRDLTRRACLQLFNQRGRWQRPGSAGLH